jgi:hypothetical protein
MDYIPILILMALAAILGGAILTVSSLLGPKLPNKRKAMPFECGVPSYGDTKQRFSVRFYLVAILFLHPLGNGLLLGHPSRRLLVRAAEGRSRVGMIPTRS